MTSNQLVLLFDTYRGFDQNKHLGTLAKDLFELGKKGLIDGEITHSLEAASRFPFHGYECTNIHLTIKGQEYCQSLMKIEP